MSAEGVVDRTSKPQNRQTASPNRPLLLIPTESGSPESYCACRLFISTRNCSLPSKYARLELHEDAVDACQAILADWIAAMPRKSRNPDFDQTLETLHAHSFDVAPFAGVAGGVLVSKYGAAAVLVAPKDGVPAFAVCPGLQVKGEVARLLDRGYQKFIQTSRFELPASAGQLNIIQRFSEELRLLTGIISLYNESLGTTSDLYRYDRLKGREAG